MIILLGTDIRVYIHVAYLHLQVDNLSNDLCLLHVSTCFQLKRFAIVTPHNSGTRLYVEF